MLQVALRELARGPVEPAGQLAGSDPLFEGLDVVLAEPVRVAGRLQAAGEGRFYWRGSLSTGMAGEGPGGLPPPPAPGRGGRPAPFFRRPPPPGEPRPRSPAPRGAP